MEFVHPSGFDRRERSIPAFSRAGLLEGIAFSLASLSYAGAPRH